MRFIVIFVIAVCVLFLIKLRRRKKKNFSTFHEFRKSNFLHHQVFTAIPELLRSKCNFSQLSESTQIYLTLICVSLKSRDFFKFVQHKDSYQRINGT